MRREKHQARHLCLLVAVLLGLTTLVVAASPQTAAQATTTECDRENVLGYFRTVEWSSFYSKGRRIELRNESLLDIYSRAEITEGYFSGDQVWIDRSLSKMPILNPSHFWDDNYVRALGGGWKQCGPFNSRRTQSVYSWLYAVRACWRPPGGPSECGQWNIDQPH